MAGQQNMTKKHGAMAAKNGDISICPDFAGFHQQSV